MTREVITINGEFRSHQLNQPVAGVQMGFVWKSRTQYVYRCPIRWSHLITMFPLEWPCNCFCCSFFNTNCGYLTIFWHMELGKIYQTNDSSLWRTNFICFGQRQSDIFYFGRTIWGRFRPAPLSISTLSLRDKRVLRSAEANCGESPSSMVYGRYNTYIL